MQWGMMQEANRQWCRGWAGWAGWSPWQLGPPPAGSTGWHAAPGRQAHLNHTLPLMAGAPTHWTQQHAAEQGTKHQMGPELLQSLYAALGSATPPLTSLSIQPPCAFDLGRRQYWACTAGFWEVLPHVLPHLQQLALGSVASLDAVSAAAMAVACSRLQCAGRALEVVFQQPQDTQQVQGIMGQLRRGFAAGVRVRVVPCKP